jgi:hypothetical protein
MRTTLVIDDDILAAARQIARRQKRSVGAVLTTLARQGLSSGMGEPGSERNGIKLLPVGLRSQVVTLSQVNRLRDELPQS